MNKLLILLSLGICLSLFSLLQFRKFTKLPPMRKRRTRKKVKDEYKRERREMVEQQIQARGIEDTSVLEAMMKVPRHKFVPETLTKQSYNGFSAAHRSQSDNLSAIHRRLYDGGCRHLKKR
jgi:hypothetical protein